MDALKPISSIISPADISNFVVNNYGLIGQCRLLKAGVNHSYLITTEQGKFIFRLYSYEWRSKKEIETEIDFLLFLSKNDISVSYPIPDLNQRYINSINAPEGLRYAVVFSFAQGEKMLNLSNEVHFNVGQTIAKMHQLTQNMTIERVNYNSNTLVEETFKFLPNFINNESDEYLYMLRLKTYLLRELNSEILTTFRKGVVHLDIWFDNMHVTPEGSVTLFDFDFCGNGWLALDLSYYILQIKSTEQDVAIFENKKTAFLAGYRSIISLTDEEINYFPVFALAAYTFYLGVQCKRFDDWSNTFLNEVYLKRFINQLVKRWADYNGLVI